MCAASPKRSLDLANQVTGGRDNADIGDLLNDYIKQAVHGRILHLISRICPLEAVLLAVTVLAIFLILER